jgi:hypothetical protein
LSRFSVNRNQAGGLGDAVHIIPKVSGRIVRW